MLKHIKYIYKEKYRVIGIKIPLFGTAWEKQPFYVVLPSVEYIHFGLSKND